MITTKETYSWLFAEADPGFQVRGGGAKMFGVFRVKNHNFTPKNHFFPILGGAHAGCAPPLDPPLICDTYIP